MSLLRRRILFAFFTLLFCLLVPIVLLYATGHAINWRKFSLEKTASILIDSKPRQATVFINGQTVKESFLGFLEKNNPVTTKTKISGLTPGNYIVRLEHDGYWPWEERFTLYPEEAFNFNVIRLFKQTTPELIAESPTSYGEFSPNKKMFVAPEKTAVLLIEIATNKKQTTTLPRNIKTETIAWSSDNQYMVLDDFLIDTTTGTLTDLSKIIKKEISLLHWSGNTLYFISNKTLWQYNIINKDFTLADSLSGRINNETIIDYKINNQKLYLITRIKSNIETLWVGNLNNKLVNTTLPTGDYHFLNQNSEKVALCNNKQAYVIDDPLPLLAKLRLLEIPNTVATSQWQNTSLIYTTPFELRQWHGENNDQLLTRFGSPIISLWPTEYGVVIADADSVQLYVNSRQPFTLNLAPIKNITDLIVSNDNTTIFIYGTYQDKTGLFSLEL